MFELDKYRNKRCLILGGGVSGLAAYKLIKEKLKSEIFISDIKEQTDKNYNWIKEEDIEEDFIKKIDFSIKSPGIDSSNRVIKLLNKYSKPIFSEVELALSFSKTQNTIMITGTNGKTTTTYLTYLILKNFLKKQNKKAILCGNVGYPASKEIPKAKEGDWIIMEISSYQLEDSTFIKPKIAIITNITPDHINHHKTFKNYIKAKLKIFSFMDKNSTLIINQDDKILKKIKSKNFKLLKFSLKDTNADIFYDGRYIVFKNEKIKPAEIPGVHNIQNQMASILSSIEAGVDIQTIQETLNSFKGLEHRIEFVKEIKGVKYYNDSKATNVDSTLIALKSLGNKKNIYLIMGGIHKGSSYTPLNTFIKKFVKEVLTIGEASKIIKTELSKIVKVTELGNIKNAVKYAYKKSKPGDIVLLSPACASFDQFKNFEERGRKFKEYVNKL